MSVVDEIGIINRHMNGCQKRGECQCLAKKDKLIKVKEADEF